MFAPQFTKANVYKGKKVDTPRESFNKTMGQISNIKNKVIDKASDVLSYPARRAAQKSILNSNRNYSILKNRSASDKANFKWSLENKGGLRGMPNQELIATPQARQKAVLKQGYKIPLKPSNGKGVGGN